MNYFRNKFKSIKDYVFDHPGLRKVIETLATLLSAALSAFIFAYAYKAFVAPSLPEGYHVQNIVTGGGSGVSQIIVKIFDICGVDISKTIGTTTVGYIIQSISYVMINVPLIILAFTKIGKRFALFTIVNVLLYFIFVNAIPVEACSFFYTNESVNLTQDIFIRSVLAGLCVGISSGIAVQTDHSSGGVDIVTVAITNKRSNSSIGKLTLSINLVIISVYTILSCIQDGGPGFIIMALYSLVYFFVDSFVVDKMVSRNKKSQLEIITTNKELPEIFISYFPHSATILNGQGAYTKQDKIVMQTVVSTSEVKRAIKIIQEIDPKSFITVTKVDQLVGRFYIAPRQ